MGICILLSLYVSFLSPLKVEQNWVNAQSSCDSSYEQINKEEGCQTDPREHFVVMIYGGYFVKESPSDAFLVHRATVAVNVSTCSMSEIMAGECVYCNPQSVENQEKCPKG